MPELQQWLDDAPTYRHATISADYVDGWLWSVNLWVVGALGEGKGTGEGSGRTLTRAVVAAILDWERLE